MCIYTLNFELHLEIFFFQGHSSLYGFIKMHHAIVGFSPPFIFFCLCSVSAAPLWLKDRTTCPCPGPVMADCNSSYIIKLIVPGSLSLRRTHAAVKFLIKARSWPRDCSSAVDCWLESINGAFLPIGAWAWVKVRFPVKLLLTVFPYWQEMPWL